MDGWSGPTRAGSTCQRKRLPSERRKNLRRDPHWRDRVAGRVPVAPVPSPHAEEELERPRRRPLARGEEGLDRPRGRLRVGRAALDEPEPTVLRLQRPEVGETVP